MQQCCRLTPALVLVPPRPIPIVLDTNIGTDIDDAFALALVLASTDLGPSLSDADCRPGISTIVDGEWEGEKWYARGDSNTRPLAS